MEANWVKKGGHLDSLSNSLYHNELPCFEAGPNLDKQPGHGILPPILGVPDKVRGTKGIVFSYHSPMPDTSYTLVGWPGHPVKSRPVIERSASLHDVAQRRTP